MGRLFGTDGIRGVAGTQLTCSDALKAGMATARVLSRSGKERLRVLIGRDTRISGDMLSGCVSAGLCRMGADVSDAGVIPTPALAYLVKSRDFDAAVMISASHNPYEYNGIKLFWGDGRKPDEETEREIEELMTVGERNSVLEKRSFFGRLSCYTEAADDYAQFLLGTAEEKLDGIKAAFDCANGSACATAAKIFPRTGCECAFLHVSPDGININRKCGSTDTDALGAYVKENRFDIGLAFDGDADRLIAVDENGRKVDGDKIIAICATQMKKNGRLKNNAAAVTVMSGFGLLRFLTENGITPLVTQVGDKYVLEKMLETDTVFGGEQSGHIIFLDKATTGDGQLTALELMSVMKQTGKKLSELSALYEPCPQLHLSIPANEVLKERLSADEDILRAVKEAEERLGKQGRLLVRASGTEPLIRIMVEGNDETLNQTIAKEIAGLIRRKGI